MGGEVCISRRLLKAWRIAQPCTGVNASADTHLNLTRRPALLRGRLRRANERLRCARRRPDGESNSALQEPAAAARCFTAAIWAGRVHVFQLYCVHIANQQAPGLLLGGAPEDNALRRQLNNSTHKTPTPNPKNNGQSVSDSSECHSQARTGRRRSCLAAVPLSRQRICRGWIPVEALAPRADEKKGESAVGKAERRENSSRILHPSSLPVHIGAGCARFWGGERAILGAGRRRPAVGFRCSTVAATLGV